MPIGSMQVARALLDDSEQQRSRPRQPFITAGSALGRVLGPVEQVVPHPYRRVHRPCDPIRARKGYSLPASTERSQARRLRRQRLDGLIQFGAAWTCSQSPASLINRCHAAAAIP